MLDNWYLGLKKSSLTPPSWVFSVVWIILYIMIALSYVVFYMSGGLYYIPFYIQMALNLSWTPIFFRLHMSTLAFVILIVLVMSVLWTMYTFYQTSPSAMYLLVPYGLWLCLATYLNWYIVSNN